MPWNDARRFLKGDKTYDPSKRDFIEDKSGKISSKFQLEEHARRMVAGIGAARKAIPHITYPVKKSIVTQRAMEAQMVQFERNLKHVKKLLAAEHK